MLVTREMSRSAYRMADIMLALYLIIIIIIIIIIIFIMAILFVYCFWDKCLFLLYNLFIFLFFIFIEFFMCSIHNFSVSLNHHYTHFSPDTLLCPPPRVYIFCHFVSLMNLPGIFDFSRATALSSPKAINTLPHPGLSPWVPSGR